MANCPTCGGAQLTERPHYHGSVSSGPVLTPVALEVPPRPDDAPNVPCAVCDGQGWLPADVHAERLDALRAAPEVPPPDIAHLIEQVNAMPLLKVSGEALSETLAQTTGVVGTEQFFCDWDEQEWFVAQSGVIALLESAATRTPEPPDSGDGAAPDTPRGGWREASRAMLRNGTADDTGHYTDRFYEALNTETVFAAYASGHRDGMKCGAEAGGFGTSECEHSARLRSGSPAPEGGESMSGWEPDWRVHPGESLREAIAALGISEAAFARKIGVTPPFVSNIVRGRKGIGPKVALKLEAAGVGPAQFWLAMQMQFDLHRAREEAAAISQQDTDRAAR